MSADAAVARLEHAIREIARVTAGRPVTGTSHDDADGDTGTIATDDAIGFDPFPLLRALHLAGARVVVMGQVAGILHGSAELTGDLDLLWDGDPAQAPALAAAFRAAGASLTGNDDRPLDCEPAAFGQPKLEFDSPAATGDLCSAALAIPGPPLAGMLRRSRIARAGDGTVIRYLDLADLAAMRRVVGRTKDLRRAAELERLAAR